MIVLEIAQGTADRMTGMNQADAVDRLEAADKEFLAKYPQCLPYHRPSWRLIEAPDNKTAPWGYEWYQVVEGGVLKWHSAQYDSSG